MTWLIGASALVLALVALWRLRVLSRRIDRMKQLQWELRYQVETLTAQGGEVAAPARGAAGERRASGTTFVPLSSVRR